MGLVPVDESTTHLDGPDVEHLFRSDAPPSEEIGEPVKHPVDQVKHPAHAVRQTKWQDQWLDWQARKRLQRHLITRPETRSASYRVMAEVALWLG